MSDQSDLLAMLDRAKIPHGELGAPSKTVDELPEGAVSFHAPGTGTWGDTTFQPHEGGYLGFFSEFVFDAAGALIAIWGWE